MPPTLPTRSLLDYVWGYTVIVIFVGLVLWVGYLALRRSEDPGQLIFKWILSALVFTFMGLVVIPMVARGGYEGAFGGIPLTAACGLCLALIWRRAIAGLVADPFGALYDGGRAEVDPQAYYSAAIAKRKRGQYHEAIAAIRKQLDRFPTDVTGQMLLAEIQAENLNDLQGAEITIHRFVAQPDRAPRNIAFALNTLADWQLKFGLDREAARGALEKIVELLPESEFALLAQQRIGHIAQNEHMLAPHDRQRIVVPEGVRNIGLLQSSAHLAPEGENLGQRAAEYVRHLEQHPQDTEAREKLAIIYADHFQRLDLAADQLNQLINQPNQPAKPVVRWLNLLADLQIKHQLPHDVVWQTLSQIIERFPNAAAAEMARNRMDLLKLEMKVKDTTSSIKLGTYEQNIGLKHDFPGRR